MLLKWLVMFLQGITMECTDTVCVPDGVSECAVHAVVPAGKQPPSQVALDYTYRHGLDPTTNYA